MAAIVGTDRTFRYWFRNTPRAATLFPDLWDRDMQRVHVLRRSTREEADETMVMVRFPDGHECLVFPEEVNERERFGKPD
jgi:hypothetical protein